MSGVGNAAAPIQSGGASQILYGPSGSQAAATLASVLSGPVTEVPDSSLTGQNVTLLVAGSELSVTAGGGAAAQGTTTTTVPASTTTTTIPADVVTNTQPEPWNPTPCTLGAPTRASRGGTTTTTAPGAKAPARKG